MRPCQTAVGGMKVIKNHSGRMWRLHLFEFGDKEWFPQVLRDAETAYLAIAYRLSPLPRHWAERILDRS